MIKKNHERAKRFHICKIIFVFLEQKKIKQMKRAFFILCLFLSSILPGQAQRPIRNAGDVVVLGLPAAALGISLLKHDKEGTFQFLKSFAGEAVTVFLLKWSINAKRPNGGNYSFPSGHSAQAFVSSTYLYKRYGWKYGLPATALATFVAYSRAGIKEPVHYLTDVLAGAFIGSLSAHIFTSKWHPNINAGISRSKEAWMINLHIAIN